MSRLLQEDHSRKNPLRLERPRVAWDMTFAYKSRTGSRVFAKQLTIALRALDQYRVIEINAKRNARVEKNGAGWDGARNVWWLTSGMSQTLAKEHADLVHVGAYLGPRRAPCPVIANVFDTTFLHYPNDFDWKWHLYARLFISNTIRSAAAILTLSRHAKQEIVQSFHAAPEKVYVVYPGVGALFRPTAASTTIAALRAHFGLNDNYLLFVGAQMPRKNIPALVGALGQAREQFPDLTLVLVGPRDKGSAEIQRACVTWGLENRVRALGFVADAELAVLYQGARAFVYASKLEGFGMPPLEAMACGTPVIAAPNPPLPEVLGDAAWFTENDSPTALAAGIARVLNDEELQNTLRQRGIERARLYSWHAAARKTIALYENVLAHAPRV